MSLTSFGLALQGVDFKLTPISLAVQGLIQLLQENNNNTVVKPVVSSGGSSAPEPTKKNPLIDVLRKQKEERKRKAVKEYNLQIQADDQLAAELIMALVTKGFLNGNSV